MVLWSIIGAVLANLLLALGLAFLLGGLRKHTQEYNAGAARVYSSIMLITVIGLAAPGAFENLFGAEAASLRSDALNVALAITLLVLYALYLVFMLKTSSRALRERRRWPRGAREGMEREQGCRHAHRSLGRRRLLERGPGWGCRSNSATPSACPRRSSE